MNSLRARQINRDTRNRDNLVFLGTLSDQTAISERVQAEAFDCPYCQMRVHPTRNTEHMERYHPEIMASLQFYGQFDAETRLALQAYKREIDSRLRSAVTAMVEIGERLIDAKARLPRGAFLRWIRLEFGWTDKGAQRLMNVCTAFKNDNLSGLTIGKAALYLLAAPSTPETARRKALAMAGSGQKLSVKATEALISQHKAVQNIVTAYGVTNPETVALLERIEGTDTFNEIAATGYIQPGVEAEAVHITDPVEDVQAALYDKSGQHAREGAANAEPIPQANISEFEGVFIATLNLGEYPNYVAAQKAITRIMKRLYAEE